MRRKEKEIKNKNMIESILQEADHCVVALSNNNCPYLVPMNFGYKNQNLYLHSSKEGKKIEILKVNNQVSFGVELNVELVKDQNPCKWGMKYKSVVGQGYAFFIEDTEKKKEALNIIMAKYSKNSNFEYSETSLNNLTVIRVEVKELTGKISGYGSNVANKE
jgi:nitroimidazol reductase NimA-like FMN-containing flavoprotein (pyridoxamine 5'-phosphate oxidase superfamily)